MSLRTEDKEEIGQIYGEKGGLAAVGGLAAPFSQAHQKKTVHPNFE